MEDYRGFGKRKIALLFHGFCGTMYAKRKPSDAECGTKLKSGTNLGKVFERDEDDLFG